MKWSCVGWLSHTQLGWTVRHASDLPWMFRDTLHRAWFLVDHVWAWFVKGQPTRTARYVCPDSLETVLVVWS